jgi:hypothetical protein
MTMTINRRHFLFGLGAAYWLTQGTALAELIDRGNHKRGVLIGVNQFGIAGAGMDVALQRELLCYRFGFSPGEIITLLDRQATRGAIEAAITNHLIQTTVPGDGVVIHFSGVGTLVGDEPALMTGDGQIIPYSTLELWLRAINTDRLLCVIDGGYRYPGTPIVGNLRVRSHPWNGAGRLSAAELSYQAELKKRLAPKLTPGVILQAAEFCGELPWDSFNVGFFTYALTQQLWQVNRPDGVNPALSNVRDLLHQFGLEAIFPPTPEDRSVWQSFISPEVGDGVVVTGEGKTGELWLGGMPLCPLAYYGAGSLLKTATQLLQVKSRNGLTAKVEVVGGEGALQKGTLVQEEVRAIPKNVNLIVAMDSSLSRIERVDATSALSTIPRTIGVNGGEQYADCVFGKDEGRYGLFTLGGMPIVDSFGSVDESVSGALRRLRPILESLLAIKLLHLTLNPHSSYLGFEAAVRVQPSNQTNSFTLFQTSTRQSPRYPRTRLPDHNLTIGDQLSCQIQNLTDQTLHIRIFCTDARYRLMSPSFVIPPYASDNVVPPQKQLIIPQPYAPVNWFVASPQGNFEVLIIVSRSPFKNLTNVMGQTAGQSTNGMLVFPNPLPIAQALFQDLTQRESEDTWFLPMQQWATIGFSYRVV